VLKELQYTSQFKRELRLARKRGDKVDLLERVIHQPADGQSLAPRHRPHRLSGAFEGAWECHVTPDFLLIWEETKDKIILLRLGTHSDVFRT